MVRCCGYKKALPWMRTSSSRASVLVRDFAIVALCSIYDTKVSVERVRTSGCRGQHCR